MNKLYYIIFLLIVLSFSCKNNDNYSITSKLQNLQDSLVLVTKENSTHIDTIVCKNGQFTITGEADSLSYVAIYVESIDRWLNVWVKNKDKITISGDTKYPDLIEVAGNEVNDKLSEFKSASRDLFIEQTNLLLQQQENAADSLLRNSNESSYPAKISNINHQLKEKAEEFVRKNPKERVSVVLIRDYLIDSDNVDKMYEFLSILQAPATETSIYKQLEALYRKLKMTSVGSPAPAFEILDVKNDTADLSDFKGKYLLLTFAASWCDVCRKDNKELVAAYEKYSKKGLQMFTVSFDEKKADWQTAAKDDKINWRQAIDTHGWGAEMLDLYNITNIPANFLIDKEGIIIDKNLFGEELMKVLEEKLNPTTKPK